MKILALLALMNFAHASNEAPLNPFSKACWIQVIQAHQVPQTDCSYTHYVGIKIHKEHRVLQMRNLVPYFQIGEPPSDYFCAGVKPLSPETFADFFLYATRTYLNERDEEGFDSLQVRLYARNPDNQKITGEFAQDFPLQQDRLKLRFSSQVDENLKMEIQLSCQDDWTGTARPVRRPGGP